MRPESKVGLVVLAFIAVVVYFSFKINGDRFPWQQDEGYRIHVLFDTVTGLETKAIVRYAGVEVGSVSEIALDEGLAKVTLKLYPNTSIRKDAVIEVGSMGFMGEKYVSIRGGTLGAPILKDNETVYGHETVSMDQLVSAVNDIGKDIKAITSAMRAAIGTDENTNRIQSIVVNLDRLTTSLADTAEANDEEIGEIVQNFRAISADLRTIVQNNQGNLNRTLEDLQKVIAALAETVPAISSDLRLILADVRTIVHDNRSNLNDTVQNVTTASSDLNRTMSKMSDMVERIDRGEGSLGKLINDDEFHHNLNTALVDIDKTALDFRKFLGQASETKLYLGYRGEYLSADNEVKNYISLHIQPRPDKFYLIELVSAPYGEFFEKDYEYHFEEPSDFPDNVRFTQREWDRSRLTYNVQFGKIFYGLTLRGGLIESTGGFGVDWEIYKKRFSVSMDAWDFGRDVDPHFKIGGKLNVSDNIFLTAGWDDFLLQNEDRDSIYFGAGLRIQDDDLKMLLGFLPMMSGS
ncbi:MCE family protein [bacterium]|nr:MCE family protein [candidate division CSSED10-310 bacterium]